MQLERRHCVCQTDSRYGVNDKLFHRQHGDEHPVQSQEIRPRVLSLTCLSTRHTIHKARTRALHVTSFSTGSSVIYKCEGRRSRMFFKGPGFLIDLSILF